MDKIVVETKENAATYSGPEFLEINPKMWQMLLSVKHPFDAVANAKWLFETFNMSKAPRG